MDSSLYLYSPVDSPVVRTVRLSGARGRSFGRPLASGARLNRLTWAQAGLACLPKSHVVVLAATISGIARLYGDTGGLIWERHVSGLRALQVTGDGETTITI